MKTPSSYSKLLKQGKITKQILGEVIYSYSKRAKNYRDQKRKYKSYRYDNYNNYEKNKEKEEEYYSKKGHLLSYLEPSCIHKEHKINNKRVRYYSYEQEYYELGSRVIREGQYFDRDLNDYVQFADVMEEQEVDLYFLYYEVGEFTFHTPIYKDNVKEYKLEVIEIDDFTTEGKDINDLLSIQFCNKVYDMIADLIICD